jgi:hypothetical protein
MMRYYSGAAFPAAICFYSFQVAALTVDLTSAGTSVIDFYGSNLFIWFSDSIKSAASTVAYGMMKFYTGVSRSRVGSLLNWLANIF